MSVEQLPTQAPLAAPSWLGGVNDLEETPRAILLAAAELFARRSPSQVSLRAIASRAGVNYGLIHHYFKTKEAILTELLSRASSTAAANMGEPETLDEALFRLVDVDRVTNYARMLAWAMLDETDPERLVHTSPAIGKIAELFARQLGDGAGMDPRILAASTVSALLGWQLYQPFITVAGQLGDLNERAATVAVLEGIRTMVRCLVESAATEGGGR